MVSYTFSEPSPIIYDDVSSSAEDCLLEEPGRDAACQYHSAWEDKAHRFSDGFTIKDRSMQT